MSSSSRSKADRASELALATHAAAVRRARELTEDQVMQRFLIKFGPVPPVCARCGQEPPTTVRMDSGRWWCARCARGGE